MGTSILGIVSRQEDIQQGVVIAFFLLLKSLEIFLRSLPADFHVNLTIQNLVTGPPLNQSLAVGIWTCKQFLYKIEGISILEVVVTNKGEVMELGNFRKNK